MPHLQRESGIDALEQFLAHELVIVNKPAEGEIVRDERAGRIAGLLQETAPLEQVVARQRLAAELAASLEAHAQRVVAKRPCASAGCIPPVVRIGGAKR